MKRNLLIFLPLIAALAGCGRTNSTQPFDNLERVVSFPFERSLENAVRVDTDIIGMIDMEVRRDSLMFIATQDPGGYVSVIDTRSGEKSRPFFKNGNGPGELLFPPYFSNTDFVGKDGGDEIYVNDFKGNLLRWRLDDVFTRDTPEIDILENAIPTQLFYALWVNDSTFLCRDINEDQSGQNRFLFTNGNRCVTESMEKLNSVTIPLKNDGYLFNILSSISRYDPARGIVVEASILMNTINIYSLSGGFEKTICVGRKPDDPVDILDKGREQFKKCFADVNLYENGFGVLYLGVPDYAQASEKESVAPRIMFFDWEGRPTAELTLPRNASAFGIDSRRGILYAFDSSEEAIFQYSISGIMDDLGVF